MTFLYSCYIIIFTFKNFGSCNITGKGQYDLLHDLFLTYDKSVKPSLQQQGQSSKTVLQLNHGIYNVMQLNGHKQQLTYTIWIRMEWMDPLLTWYPNLYNGIQKVKIPTSKIWLPDITPVGVTEVLNEMPPTDRHVVNVKYNGQVNYGRSQTIIIHCGLVLAKFPFDQQNCTTQFISWLYNEDELIVYPRQPADKVYYKESIEWRLLSYTARNKSMVYGLDPVAISEVFYDIVIERKAFYYVANFALPTFAITALTIVGLFSPFNNLTERQEKVTMGLTCLLTISVMLLKIQTDMPSSDNIPLLGLYEMSEMLLSGVATIFAVILMYLDNSLAVGKVPDWFYRIITAGMEDEKQIDDDSAMLAKQQAGDETELLHYSPDTDHMATGNMHSRPRMDLSKMEGHVKVILKSVNDMRRYLTKMKKKEKTMRRGMRICRQVDNYLMAFFLCLDCLMTIAFLLFGYL